RHTLPSVACGLLLRDGLDEPGSGLDLALHVPDERARVHADALLGGIGHPDIGQDVVAALGQVDVAVSITIPVARGLTGDDGCEQGAGDTVAGCSDVDGAVGVGERAARNRPDIGEVAQRALVTEADAEVVLVPGREVLAVLREDAVSRVLVAAPVERGTGKPT